MTGPFRKSKAYGPDYRQNQRSNASSWSSWKYPDVEQMDWREQDEFMVPELNMSWGHCRGALRKCWMGWQIAKRKGDQDGMKEFQTKINNIQEGMGIQVTDFEPF